MKRLLRRVVGHEPTVLIVLGLLVGLVTGYGAIGCRLGIEAIRRLAFGRAGDITVLARDAVPLLVLLLPAIGGLIVAPIVLVFAPEAKGHGVPEVMDAIARRGARIRPRVAVAKALASIVTLGTGGSAGWEGGLLKESIYTLKLARRGVRLRGGRDEAVLQSLTVRETMHADATVLTESMGFDEVRRRALGSRHHVFPVADAEGRFTGIVTLAALRPFLFEAGLQDVAVARDLAEPPGTVVSPDDDLETARRAFVRSAHEELPVVDPATGRVQGILREHELYAAYNDAVARMG